MHSVTSPLPLCHPFINPTPACMYKKYLIIHRTLSRCNVGKVRLLTCTVYKLYGFLKLK